jgi:dUTP pyrophosphatase
VVLVNLDPHEPVTLTRGDRIAQVVFQQVERARFVEVDRLPGSDRGAGGHGSTGGFAIPTTSGAAGNAVVSGADQQTITQEDVS